MTLRPLARAAEVVEDDRRAGVALGEGGDAGDALVVALRRARLPDIQAEAELLHHLAMGRRVIQMPLSVFH